MPNFFLAGSYTKQDYIDSMEGATLSGGGDGHHFFESQVSCAQELYHCTVSLGSQSAWGARMTRLQDSFSGTPEP